MPTGYTHPVKDGEVTTFREFATMCSRAMAVAIMQRDDGGSEGVKPLEVSTHYAEQVKEFRDKLREIDNRTDEEWLEAHSKALDAAAEQNERHARKTGQTHDRYRAMLAKVNAWHPPTDEHEGLQKFMREQLEESIRFDCTPHYIEVPNLDEYRTSQRTQAIRMLATYQKHEREEIERVAAQNAWVKAFYASLPTEEGES